MSVSFVTGYYQFLSVRCSTLRDTRTKRRSKPPRVRTGLPAANDTPLDDSSYFSPSLPGAWSVFGIVEIVLCYNNAARQKPQRIDLYRAADGRDRLHGGLSTRREIFGGIGQHGRPPPNIRRRPIHGIGGAFIWYSSRLHFRYSAICRR